MKLPFSKIRTPLVVLFLVIAVNFMAAQKPLQPQHDPDTYLRPDGAGGATQEARPSGQQVVTGNGINYNGGPVLKGNPVPIYLIWYGNWNGSGSNTQATVSLVEHFLNTLGNTPY